MKAQHVLLSALSAILFLVPLQAQIPQTISYQGMIGDSLGVPKPDGIYSFTFRLYNSADDGSALWEETNNLMVKGGLFTTQLGDQTPFGALEFDQAYWLGIQFESEAELVPRIALTSVSYSFHSMRADSARYAIGADTARFVINAPAPTGPAGGALTGFYPDPILDTNAVMDLNIVDGAVTPAKISGEGAAEGQVLMSNGTEVVWQTPPVSEGDITAVTAGNGLSGGGPAGEVSLSVAAGGIVDTMLAAGAIGPEAIADRSVTGAKLDTAGAIVGAALMFNGTTVIWQIPPVSEGDITGVMAGNGLSGGGPEGDVSLAVAEAGIVDTMIADGAVTAPKLAAESVTAAAILAGAVGTDKIDPAGATSGQALMFNGEEVVWNEPPVSSADITAVIAGTGLTEGGTTGDVTLSAAFAGSGIVDSVARSDHGHAGKDITSGIVADVYIDAAIARDSEIMTTVLATDGPESTLDADLLDGQEASEFASAAHVHAGEAITSGTVVEVYIDSAIARDSELADHAGETDAHHSRYTDGEAVAAILAADGPESTLDADLLDGLEASELATSNHNHAGMDIDPAIVTADSINTTGGVAIDGNLNTKAGVTVIFKTLDLFLGETAYTTTVSDRVILCDDTTPVEPPPLPVQSSGADPVPENGGGITITVHSAEEAPGQLLSIRNVNFGLTVMVIPSAGTTLEGGTFPLPPLGLMYGINGITLMSDGSTWWLISTSLMGPS
ncbi:hypothetical protein ACFL4U_01650 [Candidatus Neomarinimicrobiota bacterium]